MPLDQDAFPYQEAGSWNRSTPSPTLNQGFGRRKGQTWGTLRC